MKLRTSRDGETQSNGNKRNGLRKRCLLCLCSQAYTDSQAIPQLSMRTLKKLGIRANNTKRIASQPLGGRRGYIDDRPPQGSTIRLCHVGVR